jgi:hypothetical protein
VINKTPNWQYQPHTPPDEFMVLKKIDDLLFALESYAINNEFKNRNISRELTTNYFFVLKR